MASYLDDQTRAAHYGVCRAKKNRYEKILDFWMWVAVIALLGTLVIELFVNFFLYGFFLADTEHVVNAFTNIIGSALGVYAIYLRKWPITFLAAYVAIFCNVFIAVAAAVAGVVHILLAKLSKEEGWPLFDIPYDEQAQRLKNQESIIRHRAVALGERRAAESAESAVSTENTEMHDILDERADTLSVKPKGYHDRFRDAQPEDRLHTFESGIMDTLEEIGGQ